MTGAGRSGPPAAFTGLLLALLTIVLLAGLSAGAEGWSVDWRAEANLIGAIRAPRTIGAALAGALLGLAGALAQGLFRNPLADPYLLGSAAGASLGVVAVLAFASTSSAGLLRLGLNGAAFAGALAGVGLTLAIARGAARPAVLLLAGIVVGVLLNALAELLLWLEPQALRAQQAFRLGATGLLGWPAVGWLAAALAVILPVAVALARALDALVLGEQSARSLGIDLPRVRLGLVLLMAAATGAAVAQAGLVAFVGLIAPHLVRRSVAVTHRALLALSALAGAVLLAAADMLGRVLIRPEEVPVGLLTAVLGGAYLLWLLRREAGRW